ncbi:MAG: hypothetical protein AAF531_04455 [Actinomycetota bacterium]
MPVANIAEREFKRKYWAAHHSNPWAIKRERAAAYLVKAKAAARSSKNLTVQPYKKQYENARLAEVSAMNAQLSGTRGQLTNLLVDSLETRPGIGIGGLWGTVEVDHIPPPWLTDRIPGPEWADFDPGRLPLGLGRLPILSQIQRRRNEAAYARLERALREWNVAEDDRRRRLAEAEAVIEAEVAAEAARVAADNRQLQEFRQKLEAGDRDTVGEYFETVLETLAWPEGFPRRVTASYEPTRTHLDVQYLLPTDAVVPRIDRYTYDKERDRITPKPLTDEARAELYKSIVAQVTLRALRELFGSDEFNLVRTITFDGRTSTYDRATGQAVEPYLVSVTVDICDFGAVQLARVDPVSCLQILAKT